VIYAIFIL